MHSVGSIVLLAALACALLLVAVFAVIMFVGWQRERRRQRKVAAAYRRARTRPVDPQVDEDRHVQDVRRRIHGGSK